MEEEMGYRGRERHGTKLTTRTLHDRKRKIRQSETQPNPKWNKNN